MGVSNFWLTTFAAGVFRLRFTDEGGSIHAAEMTSFAKVPGPMQGQLNTNFASTAGAPFLCFTRSALYRFNAQKGNFEGASEYGARFVDGSFFFINATLDGSGALWVLGQAKGDTPGERIFGWVIPGAGSRLPVFERLPRKIGSAVGAIGNFFQARNQAGENDAMLISGSEGLVRVDLEKWKAQPSTKDFTTLIRRAVTRNEAGAGGHLPPILKQPLSYASNSVHFEFAANTYAFDAAPEYQTRLVNFGTGMWSDFSAHPSLDYLNLPEGSYTFEVRARNADGQMGSTASFSFRVLPPWQRTLWAYLLYAVALTLGVAGLVRWRGQQLRQRNAALEAIVDVRTRDLRAREAELVRARDEAESANRAKSVFLANMSHELRTPLNAILGYSQIMTKERTLPARTREQVQVIGQSGEHLLTMINEVLDLAKVEAGKLTLLASDFSLGQFLDDVSATFSLRLAEKGLAFEQVRTPGLPPVVHADHHRLRQVLFNLLSNAVKFTRQGTVRLEVRPVKDGRVRFEVSDTGVGIAADQLHAIFTAFHQTGENALAEQGTGLGLAISQRLLGLMGGKIAVESTPGQGSRFWFELPLPAGESSGGMPAPTRREEEHGLITGYEGSPRRLLVVDDEPENRRVLCDLLQPLGFEIEEAGDGARCLEACARRLPDAVLLDLRLGQPDGFEVARTLRARTAGASLGIIAVSASVFEDDRQRAIDAGCDDFLPKPFEEARLLAMLGRVLSLRWVHAANETPAAANAPETEDATPPSADEIAALLEFSLRGDIVGLRQRLTALRAPDAPPGSMILVRALEGFAASYQMDQLHERLLAFKTHASP